MYTAKSTYPYSARLVSELVATHHRRVGRLTRELAPEALDRQVEPGTCEPSNKQLEAMSAEEESMEKKSQLTMNNEMTTSTSRTAMLM
jgi:hypothetical protein